MGKFETAEAITGRNEGGFADNKADRGGETFAGIARNFWGSWPGWKFIDKYKADWSKSDKKLSLAQWVNASVKVPTEPVAELVSKFYKQNFWDVNKLDAFADQQLANSVYDFGVNSGSGRAAQFLQRAANDTGLVKLVVDGAIGVKTIDAINSLNQKLLYDNFNKRREDFYRSIAIGSQKQFLNSWLSRLKPYKVC